MINEIAFPETEAEAAKPLILVVDDEAFMRTIIQDALGELGLDVVAVSSGEEMLETLTDMLPDAVVLDVVMPGLDGYASCEALRKMPGCEHLPVMMLTGKDDLESIERAFEAGATDFMTKPVNAPIMAYRLRYLLRAAETAKSLRTSEQRLARAQLIARLAYWSYNPSLRQVQVAEMGAQLLGLERGSGWYQVTDSLEHVATEHHKDFLKNLESLRNGDKVDPQFIKVRLGGDEDRVLRVTWDKKKTGEDLVNGTLQDVTEITSAQERIEYLAYFDDLTGLANRALFLQRLADSLAAAKRYDRTGALLYLDVHHFKRINDTLGLELGDRLLQEIALRLRRFVRECDVLAYDSFEEGGVSRLGGDEFCILLNEINRPDDAALVVERLTVVMSEPFMIDGHQVSLNLRTGISVFPCESAEPELLLKQAYTALNHAEETSGAYQFYEQSMTEAAVKRLTLEQEIRHGIDRGDFELHYQPLVNIHNGDVVGVEALARWQHPERGMISPAEFIPVAEESGLMVPLGQALIKAACTQAAAWVEAGHKDLRMSVNISPRQFLNDDIYALLERVLAETGLPPRNLEVEVTESLLLDDSSEADKTLQRVKEMGVGIAVDDFGTGYSSLSYLHAFPIDTLKIDRSFVSNGSNGGQARAILNAIVAMGKSLELKILAEGIETEGQRELLSGLGCHEAQGYHFSRPMPADEVVGLF